MYLGDLVGSSLSKGPERSRSPSNCAPHPLQTCTIIIPIPQGRKLRLSGQAICTGPCSPITRSDSSKAQAAFLSASCRRHPTEGPGSH